MAEAGSRERARRPLHGSARAAVALPATAAAVAHTGGSSCGGHLFLSAAFICVAQVLQADAVHPWVHGDDGTAISIAVVLALIVSLVSPLSFLLCSFMLALCLTVGVLALHESSAPAGAVPVRRARDPFL